MEVLHLQRAIFSEFAPRFDRAKESDGLRLSAGLYFGAEILSEKANI